MVVSAEGEVRGVEAVIDKDYAASMLAASLSADLFIILTGVDRVARDFGEPTETPLPEIDVATARELAGPRASSPRAAWARRSMPRSSFVEAGGREVLITRAESLSQALEGKTGTLIKGSG